MPNGIYDGFEGYKSPSDEDYRHAVSDGLIILDTNVILNLYRYTASARNDLLSILDGLKDRLWVPHQVMSEFWASRSGVIRDSAGAASQVAGELGKFRDQALRHVSEWSKRVAYSEDDLTTRQSDLAAAFEAIIEAIEEETNGRIKQNSTGSDPVIEKLTAILDGRVGAPFNPDAKDLATVEADRRASEKIPPGFRDSAKSQGRGNGDYFVWEQTLLEAKRRATVVWFITGDDKDDWWREENGQRQGPRLELVEEMRARADVPLLMSRPASFMKIAAGMVGVVVDRLSLLSVQRVDDAASDIGGPIRRGQLRQMIVRGDYGEARAGYERLIGIFPQDSTLYIGRAEAHFGLGNVAAALADLEYVEFLDPNRQDVTAIRVSMLADNYTPRGRTPVESLEKLGESIRRGDPVSAGLELDEAIRAGFSNSAFISMDKAMIALLKDDPYEAAIEVRTAQESAVGPYVKINVAILELLVESRGGVEIQFAPLNGLLEVQRDYRREAGPILWLEEGLKAAGLYLDKYDQVFAYLDQWEIDSVRHRRRTRGGIPIERGSEEGGGGQLRST